MCHYMTLIVGGNRGYHLSMMTYIEKTLLKELRQVMSEKGFRKGLGPYYEFRNRKVPLCLYVFG